MTTLVIYVFHEHNSRVDYFIRNALFEDASVQFLFVANSMTIERPEELPAAYTLLKRPNIGYDFGAWSYGLFHEDNYTKFDNFIFVNSTVVGPFLPPYYKAKWTDIFVEGLKEAELFGCTINTLQKPATHSHIQSYLFSAARKTVEFLIERQIFSTTEIANSWTQAIISKEIRMSREIVEAGWRIACLMRLYKDVDFRFKDKRPEDYRIPFMDDCMYAHSFSRALFGNFYETVFIKGNRIDYT